MNGSMFSKDIIGFTSVRKKTEFLNKSSKIIDILPGFSNRSEALFIIYFRYDVMITTCWEIMPIIAEPSPPPPDLERTVPRARQLYRKYGNNFGQIHHIYQLYFTLVLQLHRTYHKVFSPPAKRNSYKNKTQ